FLASPEVGRGKETTSMFGIHHVSENVRAHRVERGLSSRSIHRNRRRRHAWAVEALEDRTLLSKFTVNSLGDTGAGTGPTGDLRYCITQANHTTGDNTIKFAVTGTITLNSALPDLSNTTGTTDIDGPGAKKLTVARNSAAGTPAFRIFTIDTGTTVNLSSLTITGGLATQGGGLFDDGGTVSLTKVTVTNNQAVGAAGVAGVAGAV